MRLSWQNRASQSAAIFAHRQLEAVLSLSELASLNLENLKLTVRDEGVPGAWYYEDTCEIIVDVALQQHALQILRALFFAREKPPLIEFARAHDNLLGLSATANYRDTETYSHGFGMNHWIRGVRVGMFEEHMQRRLSNDPSLAAPVEGLSQLLGSAVPDVAIWLRMNLDQCVDLARLFFVFVCLHELGHHLHVQDGSTRSALFEVVGEAAPDGQTAASEERYADAFAVIGAAACRETTLSGEQFLFARALYEFLIGTIIDQALFLGELVNRARYATNRLFKYERFRDLRALQQRTTTVLNRWEEASFKSRTLEEHYLTANPAFARFDFAPLAHLHEQWLASEVLIRETPSPTPPAL